MPRGILDGYRFQELPEKSENFGGWGMVGGNRLWGGSCPIFTSQTRTPVAKIVLDCEKLKFS